VNYVARKIEPEYIEISETRPEEVPPGIISRVLRPRALLRVLLPRVLTTGASIA